MMKGTDLLTTEFNVNGNTVYGSVKQNKDDTFIEIRTGDTVKQKMYNGSIANEDQMISEMESLVEELFDVN